MDQGVLPDVWKTATIVPAHKKGSKTDCNNYRPILLTCICSKILEHVIYSNISKHLNEYNVLCDEQHGFRNCTPYCFYYNYVNDLPDCIYNKIKLYADDVLLYSVIRSTADCIRLQEDLNLLHRWSVLWLMDFNPVKCEFLRITNKKNPIVYQYYIGSSVIKSRYLTVSTWGSLLMKV